MAPDNISHLLRRPVVVAPMAGGPSTPELVSAAAAAGAMSFLAAGYKTAPAMAAEMAAVRAATTEPFGVNVFVPGRPSATPEAVAAYLESLAGDCEAVGCTLGEATWDDDHFDEKVAVLLGDPPSLVSFTFGCPSPEVVAALHEAGSFIAVTVTSAAEAAAAVAAGADALCVQGSEAGAHRGSFSNDDLPSPALDLFTLLDEVLSLSRLPLIAAGGMIGADRRQYSVGRRSGGRPVRDGIPARPGERRPPGLQGRPRRWAFRGNGPHAGIQRAAGPRPRERIHQPPQSGPGRLPGDQQRHPAASVRRRRCGRRRADEPLGRHGIPRERPSGQLAR